MCVEISILDSWAWEMRFRESAEVDLLLIISTSHKSLRSPQTREVFWYSTNIETVRTTRNRIPKMASTVKLVQ